MVFVGHHIIIPELSYYLGTTKLTNLPGTTITFFTSLPVIYLWAISDSRAYFSSSSLEEEAGTEIVPLVLPII